MSIVVVDNLDDLAIELEERLQKIALGGQRFEAARTAMGAILGAIYLNNNTIATDQREDETLAQWVARGAVYCADALLAELDKKPEVEG
jgi:hypothetical protein